MKSFRHDTNERNKSNVLKLRMKLGAAGYGIYMMLLERIASEPLQRAELNYEVLSYDFHESVEMIRSVVEDFDLFVIDIESDTFSHEGLNNQLSAKAKRAKQEKLLDEFISGRLSDSRCINSLAATYNTSTDRIRTLVRGPFRERILSVYSAPTSSFALIGALNTFIKETFGKQESGTYH